MQSSLLHGIAIPFYTHSLTGSAVKFSYWMTKQILRAGKPLSTPTHNCIEKIEYWYTWSAHNSFIYST